VGTGKTILLRKLMRHLDGRVQFVFISNSHLTSYGLTELIVQNLAISNKERSRLEMLQDLHDYLIQQLRSGRTIALLVDEAQKLSDEALEGLCDLSNLETDEEKLLQIVLVGQPEVTIKLNKPSLRRIKQRITSIRCRRPLKWITTFAIASRSSATKAPRFSPGKRSRRSGSIRGERHG
jgi:MSHA biogenesis protein MshM